MRRKWMKSQIGPRLDWSLEEDRDREKRRIPKRIGRHSMIANHCKVCAANGRDPRYWPARRNLAPRDKMRERWISEKIEKRRFTYFLLIVIAREICPCNRINSNRIEVSPNLRGNGLSSGKWTVRSAWVLHTYTYLLIHIINCIMQCNPFKWAVIKTDLSLRHHPRGFVLSFLFSIKWEEAFNAN